MEEHTGLFTILNNSCKQIQYRINISTCRFKRHPTSPQQRRRYRLFSGGTTCIWLSYSTCMTSDGPPLTISGGIWLSGQFSILMISSFEHSASSNGRLVRFALSLMYSDCRLSSVAETSDGVRITYTHTYTAKTTTTLLIKPSKYVGCEKKNVMWRATKNVQRLFFFQKTKETDYTELGKFTYFIGQWH